MSTLECGVHLLLLMQRSLITGCARPRTEVRLNLSYAHHSCCCSVRGGELSTIESFQLNSTHQTNLDVDGVEERSFSFPFIQTVGEEERNELGWLHLSFVSVQTVA